MENTLALIKLESDSEMSKAEKSGIATFLMNIYTGMENILRNILEEDKGMKIRKSEQWHKQLLASAVDQHIISEELRETLLKYMRFRHYHTHGYGYMTDWNRVKPLAENAKNTVERFFSELKKKGFV